MNGRLYDPDLHRFLMPDNFVQDPFSTQSFNRYAYCLNNPLMYVDENGEFIITAIIIGAVVGAYIGGSQANGTYNPFKWNYSSSSTWLGMGGGALVGGLSGGAGAYVGGAVSVGMASMGITGGVIGGAVTGAVSGAVGGFIMGGGMAILPGGNGDFWGGAWKGGAGGFVSGGLIGGAAGAIFTPKGHNIWTGKAIRQPATQIEALSKGINMEVEGLNAELSLKTPTQTTTVQPEINLVPVKTPDGGLKMINQFSSKTIDDAVNLIIKDPNKLNHLFPPKHNLGAIVDKLGGQENTIRAVLNAANGKLPASGLFKNIPINVSGQTIFIRGNVINGVPRLGTMYIP